MGEGTTSGRSIVCLGRVKGHCVTGVRRDSQATTLVTSASEMGARWVVNAAGLHGDVIDGLFGFSRFTVVARRAELIFDDLARPMAGKIVLPVPSAAGKGVLVRASPTI